MLDYYLKFNMCMKLLIIILSLTSLESANVNESNCETFPLYSDSRNKNDVYVKCEGNFIDIRKLKPILEKIKNPISVFELRNALLDTLPADVFHDVKKPLIRKIVFRNITMSLIEIPELGNSPFKSVKDRVQSLEIYNCSKVFAWNFHSLKFENLKSIIIEDTDLYVVTDTFSNWPHLRFIQITHSKIQWIKDNAFKANKKLTICSLAYNNLSYIYRSLFPKPARLLYSIDLSFNKLEELAADMFADMDMLRELKIDNNRLRSLSLETLSPVWNSLTQLWLSNNIVECDTLCWMAEKKDKPMFLESSYCERSGMKTFVGASLQNCSNLSGSNIIGEK